MQQNREMAFDHRWLILIFDLALSDVRHAARLMLRSPGLTATALLTLMLAIGATTTVYSIIDAVLFRALPYSEPERIVKISNDTRRIPLRTGLNVGISRALRTKSSSIASIAHYRLHEFSMKRSGDIDDVSGAYISPSLFAILRVKPFIGRTFHDDENQSGRELVVLLGYDLWRRRFAESKSLTGETIGLDEKFYTVIGIMPRGFRFPDGKAELWVPETMEMAQGVSLPAIARLNTDVSIQQAAAEVTSIARALNPQGGEAGPEKVYILPLHEESSREVKPALTVLFSSVVIVLLIACINLINLMAARSRTRRKEFAIRTALGARRWAIMRQSLAESLFLSLTGGALGLFTSYFAIPLFIRYSTMKFNSEYTIGVNGRVLFFNIAISLFVGMLVGVRGTSEMSKLDLHAILNNSKCDFKFGKLYRFGNGSLLVFQIAIGFALLIVAGLLIRSFLALISVDPGFTAEGVLTASIKLPRQKYTQQHALAFYQKLQEDLSQLAEIEAVAIASGAAIPLTGRAYGTFYPQGWPKDSELPMADFARVSPEYFKVLRFRLLRGRFFNELDRARAPGVVLVNETLAKRFFPGLNPIGRTIGGLSKQDPITTIIGVVADVKYYGLAQETIPCRYYSIFEPGRYGSSMLSARILIRTHTKAEKIIPIFRDVIERIDHSVMASEIKTMDGLLWQSLAQPRFYAVLMASFALSALLLVLLGIYGSTSYTVGCRTKEYALRLALGAQPASIYRLVIGQSIIPTVVGIAAGISMVWPATHLLSSLLFGIKPFDPVTVLVMPVFLTTTILLASYMPARRAISHQPMIALKEE